MDGDAHYVGSQVLDMLEMLLVPVTLALHLVRVGDGYSAELDDLAVVGGHEFVALYRDAGHGLDVIADGPAFPGFAVVPRAFVLGEKACGHGRQAEDEGKDSFHGIRI